MPDYLDHNGIRLAFERGKGQSPGIMFLGGYASDMSGTKAGFLAEQCARAGYSYLRFDYRGHGQSAGKFQDGCIGDWSEDALAIFDHCTEGPQILVGSSMGGWIALKLALARPKRVAGIVGIAAAPDFTEDLVWDLLPPEKRLRMEQDGFLPGEGGMIYTHRLVTEGRGHLMLRAPIDVLCPLRLLHGQKDDAVPWRTSIKAAELAAAHDVRVTLIKDGDHRLNREQDLMAMWDAATELRAVSIAVNAKAEHDQAEADHQADHRRGQ
ncbi:MAG: alpha/beta hydrolase [Alphaproteobacteria bacterium]